MKFLAPVLGSLVISFAPNAWASCDRLTPADAAVLSKQQLSNRYCAARMGVANAEDLLKTLDEKGITRENPIRRMTIGTLTQCSAAGANIEELYREKYRSSPPRPDLTKNCPGS
jgi:hypothetical protein